MGLGAEIAALASERALEDLRAPVERLTMADVAGLPASGPMEDFLIPDRARIMGVLRRLARSDRASRVNGRGVSVLPELEAMRPRPWNEVLITSTQEIPQAASIVEVDLTRATKRLEAGRQAWLRRGIEPNLTPYFAEALLAAIRSVPQANAAFDAAARGVRRHPAVHLGLSVASLDGQAARHGVVRDADTRNVLGLAMEIESLRSNGAENPDALIGATVSMADYGPDSALFAVPMVLPGQVAAARVGGVEERLVTRERGFAVAPTAYVCASIDHRALDGMDAGALLTAMKRFLELELELEEDATTR
jgi:pyruvate/2-oxoglutarate dehydrogenase complex dihydrolipoamide acyltransferase (E2) component